MRKIILFLFLYLGIGVQKSLSQVRDTIVIHDTVYVEKPKKKPTPMKWRAFVVQDEQGRFLVEKNTQADLLSGFWHSR